MASQMEAAAALQFENSLQWFTANDNLKMAYQDMGHKQSEPLILVSNGMFISFEQFIDYDNKAPWVHWFFQGLAA